MGIGRNVSRTDRNRDARLIRLRALAVAAGLTLVACGGQEPTNDNGTQLPNPASQYCEEQGGTVEIRDESGGQRGVCVFDDGSECDEWEFYRGECEPGNE